MKIDFRSFFSRILNPPFWAKILTFTVSVISAIGAVLMLFLDYQTGVLSIIAYTLFGVAGLSLAYSVYLIIPLIPKIKNGVTALLYKYELTRLISTNFGVRTLVFAIGSFIMSIFTSALNAYMGIVNRSIWYGSLAGFYVLLALIRGGVLTYHKNRLFKNKNTTTAEIEKAKVYRNCGIITLVLNVALSASIAQMIFNGEHFSYVGWTVFAYAAYAFYKITTSIISFIKAHKQEDLTVRAIRNINLVDAFVSILALQTALLTSFNTGEIDVSLMNTFTGIVVSAVSIGIGIYMIVYARKKIKLLQKERKKNEQ